MPRPDTSRPRRPPARALCAFAAVAAALGLAACSAGGSGGSVSSSSGAFGSVPTASGKPVAGHGHLGGATGLRADLDHADRARGRLHRVQHQLLPVRVCGGRCTGPRAAPARQIDQSLSLATMPTYCNGDKTVTVKLKTTYKWNDGQPVTAKDALFYLDEVRAAVNESGVQLGPLLPRASAFPTRSSAPATPNATTLVLNLNKSVNPMWFTENKLALIQPMPAHAWAKASASGPILDFTNPANAKRSTTSWPRRPARPAPTRPTRSGRSWTARTGSPRSTTPPARTRWRRTRATAARSRPSRPDAAGGALHVRHRRVQRRAVQERRHRLHAADRPAAARPGSRRPGITCSATPTGASAT